MEMSRDVRSLFKVAASLISYTLTARFVYNCKCPVEIKKAVSSFDITLDKIENLPTFGETRKENRLSITEKCRSYLMDYVDTSREVIMACRAQENLSIKDTFDVMAVYIVTTLLCMEFLWKNELSVTMPISPNRENNMDLVRKFRNALSLILTLPKPIEELIQKCPESYLAVAFLDEVKTTTNSIQDFVVACQLKLMEWTEESALSDKKRLPSIRSSLQFPTMDGKYYQDSDSPSSSSEDEDYSVGNFD